MSASDSLGPQFGQPLPPLSQGAKNRFSKLGALRGGRRGDMGSQRNIPVHQRLVNTKPHPKVDAPLAMGSLYEQLAPGRFSPSSIKAANSRLN